MVAFGISVIAVIVLPIVCGDTYAALLHSNWVFAYGPGGIWVNLRSYRNHRLKQADTVVHFSFDELEAAQEDIVRRSEDMGDGTMTWREFSLCLQLRKSNVDRLMQAIASERNLKSTTKLLCGLITISGRSNHTPVRVTSTGSVRIMWRSRYDFVRPGLSKVLNRLSKYVHVPESHPGSTEPDWRTLSSQQFDDRILELVEAGETIAAVKLLKLRRGYSVTQARRFVDELTGRFAT